MLHIAEHLLTRRVQRCAALKKWCSSKRFVFNLPVPTQTKVKPPEACAATNDTSGGFTPEATGPDKNFRAFTHATTTESAFLIPRCARSNAGRLEVATCRSQSFSSRQPRNGFWRAMARLVRLFFLRSAMCVASTDVPNSQIGSHRRSFGPRCLVGCRA